MLGRRDYLKKAPRINFLSDVGIEMGGCQRRASFSRSSTFLYFDFGKHQNPVRYFKIYILYLNIF